MATAERSNDYLSEWGEFQQQSYARWVETLSHLSHPWLDAIKGWQGMDQPFQPPETLKKWNELTREFFKKAAGGDNGDPGQMVVSRLMGAGNGFMALNEFWMEALKDLPALSKARGDADKSRKIFESWVERYKKVFEKTAGTPVSSTAEEMMTSWLNILQMNQSVFGMMWNPLAVAMPQWKEPAEKLMQGDLSALAEGFGLWRESYHHTLGRVFNMPAFGPAKEHAERMKRVTAEFLQFEFSLPYLQQYFFNTGITALKAVFNKIQDLNVETVTPETLREIYKIWLSTNEDAFFELFKRPDFSNTMGEVVNCGLRFKKRLDEVTAKWCEAMSIPSNRDLDKMAMAIQDLRRQVRAQQKTIETLQTQLEGHK